ncbi:rhodanese-like domain-containing protein [Ferruginibacter sp.]|nr:rhodanese-like domain-containing protein [Ferruginibacter sp.]
METQQIFVNQICPTSTQAWIKKGAILVDIRETDEVNELQFNVPLLQHIPLSEFEERYTELPMDKELVIVCQDGTRSLRATAFLIHKGYDAQKVVNMKHGMIRWVQKGFATFGDTSLIAVSENSGCCGGGKKHTQDHEHNHGSCCGGH